MFFCILSKLPKNKNLRELSLVSKSKTVALNPEEDPFDEIRPINTELEATGEEHLIVVTLPQNNQVRSNVRRITVSTNFDGVTEIQVKQKLLDCWWLQSNIREAHKIKRLFSKFKRFVESIKVFFGRLVTKLQDLVTS